MTVERAGSTRRTALRWGLMAAGSVAAVGCSSAAPGPPGAPANGPAAVPPAPASPRAFGRADLVRAVERARPGSTVSLAPGIYTNDGDPVDLPANTTLQAPAGATVLGAGLLLGAGSRVVGLAFRARSKDGSEVAVSSDPAAQVVGATVQGCSFTGYAGAIRFEQAGASGRAAAWRIAGNRFVDCQSAIFAISAHQHVIDANTMTSSDPSTQAIVLYGGEGNTISRNRIDTGITGILLLANRQLDGPADQFLDNTIADNVVSGCSEEHISLDCHGNDPDNVAAIDHDAVAAVGLDGAITLASAGWSGAGSRFTGYHMMVNSGRLAGRAARILRHDAGTFLVDLPADQIAAVAPGDVVIIGAPFLRTSIRGNTVDATARGQTSSIALYGLCYDNEVVGNTCSGRDISVQSLNSLARSDAQVTGTLGIAPTESNRITGNIVDRGATIRLAYTDFGASPPFLNHGNVAVGNDLRDGAVIVLDHQAPPA